MDSQCSEYKSQESVIRQGCPLSPILFTLLMCAMFKDIKTESNSPKQNELLPGIEFAEIFYADDTRLSGTHTHRISNLLHAIQAESRYFNMSVKYGKCINLTLNHGTSSIKYVGGTLVPHKPAATYLGSLLTDTVDNHREVCNHMQMLLPHATDKLVWNKAQNTVKWKLIKGVRFNVEKQSPYYGLQCIQLTQSDQINLMHFRCKDFATS